MHYQEYPIHPALAPLVECLWSLEMATPATPATPEVVVPDGRPELLVHYGDRYRAGHDAPELQPQSFLHGQLARPLALQPSGRTGIVAARLRPYAIAPLASIAAAAATGMAVPLDELWGRDGAELEARVAEARNTAARVAALERWLLRRAAAARPDAIVAGAVDLVHVAAGRSSVVELSEQVGLGRRQLERRFRDAVGLGPKRFARIVRLQHVLRLVSARRPASWADTALACGYYDQAHLSREFRELTGDSPQRYVDGQHALADRFAASPDLGAAQEG